jgi:integrase
MALPYHLSTDETQVHQDHQQRAILAPEIQESHSSSLLGQSQINRCPVAQCPHLLQFPDDGILLAWLDEKTGRSRSWKTHVSYHSTVLSLRQALRAHDYDLLMDISDDECYASYLLIVQRWAGTRATTSHHKGEITSATYNHRLATISSFFDYAKRMRLYRGDNPIDAIARRTVGDQQGAKAIEMVEMRKRLARIDRTTEAGRRDYALLCVALQTAQRGQALADMYVGDLTWSGDRLSVHFPRTKGGEMDNKDLEVGTSAVLADYLRHQYGENWHECKDAPVWVSYSRNHCRGTKLSIQAIEQICAKHLCTSKSHVIRHTASLALDDLGVPTSEIQTFLRHANIATTSTYLKRQKRARNRYGHDLEQVFGISAAYDEE